MTIINGIEIDKVECRENGTKLAIQNNDKLEDKLKITPSCCPALVG